MVSELEGQEVQRPEHPQEELYRLIVTEAHDAIIFADREGIIRLWNTGAEAMFGYQAAEALGQTLDLIVPEKLRRRHWEGYRQVMATGVSRYGQELLAVPAIRKDSSPISIEFTLVVIGDASQGIKGVAAIIREVTTRWQEMKALKQRLTELESRLLLGA